jgi:hypothetical protein
MVTDCLSISDVLVKALLGSGATHCFVDSSLVSEHHLPTNPLPQPMPPRLFDCSYAPKNTVYETLCMKLPFPFPSKALPVSFLVTPLDPDISAVIGLRWLRQYNPLVDWANNRIEFRNSEISTPASAFLAPEWSCRGFTRIVRILMPPTSVWRHVQTV